LEEIGVDYIPQTYEEIIEVGKLAKKDGLFLMVRPALVLPNWWERWFDFFTLYNAINGHQPFIVGNDVVADEEAVLDVFRFYEELQKEGLILTQEIPDAFAAGDSLWTELGPWTFPGWKEQYPEMVYGENFTLTMPPVPEKALGNAANLTFGDAKGLVMYAQRSQEEQEAIWEFIRWVFSRPENDLAWFEHTSLPPVRDDLAENQVFADYLADSPALSPYAAYMAQAIPPFANGEFADIQTALGEEGLIPLVRGQKTAEQAWKDAKAAIEQILNR
jgi:multiple sugar transport system substrate-binding protein